MYPVVEGEVKGTRYRALLVTTALSFYTSPARISKLNRNPDQRECKRIEMMMTWTSQKIEMCKFQVSNIKGGFNLPTLLRKVEKGILLTIKNLVWI